MKLMSMREDAKSRFISSQVMKRSLYESVVSPSNRLAGKRRYSTLVPMKRRPQSYHDSRQEGELVESGNSSVCCPKELTERWRDVQSLPVSPCQSPRASKRFCGSVASQSRDLSSEFLTGKPLFSGSRHSVNLSRTSLLLISRKEVADSGLASLLQPPCPKFVSATDLTSPSKEDDHKSDSSDSLNRTSSNESESGVASSKPKKSSRKMWNDENLFCDVVPSRLEPISSGSSLAPSMGTADDRQSLLSLLAANAENDEESDDNGGSRNRCEFLKPKNIPEETMEDQM